MSQQITAIAEWSHTSTGALIELYHSVPSRSHLKPLMFIGGVHGDEPEGVELANKLLRHLQNSPNSDYRPWVLIPCINPDGYKKLQRTNANGVDLNRNFPCQDWSPEAKAPRYNPGPHPGSENETKAIVKAIQTFQPEVIVHFHSWEPCVVYTGSPGKPWADLIGQHCGYESREDIGYPTPGSLGQYGWLEHQIPVICIEEQERIELSTIWPRFNLALHEVLRFK